MSGLIPISFESVLKYRFMMIVEKAVMKGCKDRKLKVYTLVYLSQDKLVKTFRTYIGFSIINVVFSVK